jgi:putative transposase
LIEPFMPAPSRLGRPRATELRAAVSAILYMASTGCQWRALPKEFPPYLTVQGYFYAWSREGKWEQINHALAEFGHWTVEVIRHCDASKDFVALPCRWVVERTFAWLGRCLRLAKDFEATITSAIA